MKNIYSLLVLCLLTASVFAQSNVTQNFIKIVGQSNETLKATGMQVEYTLSEIQGNEYKQIRYKPIAEVEKEFNAYLKKSGIDMSKAVHDKFKDVTKSAYNKTATKNYKIDLDTKEELFLLSEADVQGFKIGKYSYVYPEFTKEMEDKLALKSIDEARVKANALAKHAGKKVGEILNIEDSTRPTSKYSSSNANKSTKTYDYKIIVTFKMD